MAKKTTKLRPWTEEHVRTLKTLAREKTKTVVIARKLKRTWERRTPRQLCSACQWAFLGRGEGRDKLDVQLFELDFLAALALKKTTPKNSGVIFH
jgi:hypothetical protein